MQLEQRVERLEREIEVLKKDIRQTLLDVQDSLPEKPASPSRWRNKAWVLALLNLLLSIALFTNIRFYTADSPFGVSPVLAPWLRAFWVALMFVWLLLQMYPLMLLLDQEEKQLRDGAWRNTATFFISNPALTLALTAAVLAIAAISALFPSLWMGVIAVLFIIVCINAALYVLGLHRQRTQ